MRTLAYYNGTIAEMEEMSIPMNDRASFFGDGCYDATYCRNYNIYCLEAHLDRFYNSARLLDMEVPMPKEELTALLNDLVRRVDDHEQFVYIQLTRGTGMRDHCYGASGFTHNLWINLKPCKVVDTYRPIQAVTVEDKRFFYCNIKTLNLLPNVLAAEKARAAGCGEAIFYRAPLRNDGSAENKAAGRVTECAHSNIHILKNGTFRTAPLDDQILPGIARANLIAMCGKLGIPVDETPFTVAEMMDADEVIHSSSGSFCVPVDVIDGISVGGKDPVTLKKLQDALVADWLQKTE
ncbi:MAG: aminotransferase class IV [Clostridia bacterium]|nr:aminotransferase class IV [Clostridia bacterium]